MTQEHFDSINNQLVEWGLVTTEYLDNLTYYNATQKGEDFISFTNSSINKVIQQSLCSISSGAVSGVLMVTT